jgi:hypothetical protein
LAFFFQVTLKSTVHRKVLGHSGPMPLIIIIMMMLAGKRPQWHPPGAGPGL